MCVCVCLRCFFLFLFFQPGFRFSRHFVCTRLLCLVLLSFPFNKRKNKIKEGKETAQNAIKSQRVVRLEEGFVLNCSSCCDKQRRSSLLVDRLSIILQPFYTKLKQSTTGYPGDKSGHFTTDQCLLDCRIDALPVL